MNKEKRNSELLTISKKPKVKTQKISLSLAYSKKANSNSKSNSLRHRKNIELKFRTTKCSPEKTNQQIEEETKNKITINQREIEKNANEFILKKVIKAKHNETKIKTTCLNYTNPFHPKNKITNIIITNQKNTDNHNKLFASSTQIKSSCKKRFVSPYNANINLITNQHKSSNSNSKKLFQIKKQTTSQTTPVTNQNSRKTSEEKKIFSITKNLNTKDIKFIVQNKKNSALANVTHQPQQLSGVSINQTNNSLNALNYYSYKTHLTSANSPSHYSINFNNKNVSSIAKNSMKISTTSSKSASKGKVQKNSRMSNSRTNFEYKSNSHGTNTQNYNYTNCNSNNSNNNNIIANQINNTIKRKNIHSNNNKKRNNLINKQNTANNPSIGTILGKINSPYSNKKTENQIIFPQFKITKTISKSGNFPKKNINQNIYININKYSIPISRKSKSKSNSKPKLPSSSHQISKRNNPKTLNKNSLTNPYKNSKTPIDTSKTFNISISSLKSSLLKEGTYYSKESEILSQYIKKYYETHKTYPKTKISFYKFGRPIGRGAFGKVNIGLHVLSGKIVAIKSFNKKKLKNDSPKSKIEHEIDLMKTLRHTSIVKILERLETENYILIIMENIAGGDLLSYIKKRTKLPEKTSKIIFRQLIKSLRYLHSHNIVHRDIKLDNILIDLNNTIKLCDFGISRKIKKGHVLKDQCGTPAYIAPEILVNQGYEGYPVDLWSSGVVLYAMLSGTVPFRAKNITELHELIIKGEYSEIKGISPEASNLIKCLLETNPHKRITVDGVLEHPWLIGVCDDSKNVSLFTKAEIVLLSKANVDYRTCRKDEMIENFTIKNLETINDIENKNIKTKSVILAPFNSTLKGDDNIKEDIMIEKEIKVEKRVLQFNMQSKVCNRNYELNYNGEFDHGILIQHSKSKTHDSIKHKNHESNKVDSSELSVNNQSPDAEGNKIISEGDLSSKKDSQRSSSMTNSSTLIFDEGVIKRLENFGYNKEYVHKCLTNNDLNYATATYYLMKKYNTNENL